MNYLTINSYTTSIVYTHKRCYRLLKGYLESIKMPYSLELANKCLKAVSPGLCQSTLKNYRLAVSRVNDSINHLEIKNTKNAYMAVQHYQQLKPWCKEKLDEFLTFLSKNNGPGSIQEHRISASKFLIYMSICGINDLSEISHWLIRNYYRNDSHKTQKAKDIYNELIRHFLAYFSNKGIVKASIPLTLNKFTLNRLVLIYELPISQKGVFAFKESADCLTAQEFYLKAIVLGKTCLDRHRYSITMKKTFRKAWGELFVFLEANELDYCQETALCWAGYMQHYTTQWKTFRRAVKLFEQYRYTNDIQPIKVYTYQEDKAENLPKWCRDDYKSFIQDKYMEELAPSTVQMYRSACLRFLGYLNKVGISDWNMLTPEIIKDFHFYDPHSTPEARNAYSVKCRYFLEYLSLKGYIPLIFKVSIVK